MKMKLWNLHGSSTEAPAVKKLVTAPVAEINLRLINYILVQNGQLGFHNYVEATQQASGDNLRA